MWTCKPLFFVLSSLVLPVILGSADSGPVKIAAWKSWIGQRVAFQEPETGGIRYSLCNSDVPEIPTGPHDRNVFHALQEVPPRMGTALVGLYYRWPQNISIAGVRIKCPGGKCLGDFKTTHQKLLLVKNSLVYFTRRLNRPTSPASASRATGRRATNTKFTDLVIGR